MSLEGLPSPIGVIVDASIVLVENAYRNVRPGAGDQGDVDQGGLHEFPSFPRSRLAGPFSLLLRSWLFPSSPCFLLEGQEGKLFRPLAFTKTFVLGGSAIIAITVPVLMVMLTRGRFRRDGENPLTPASFIGFTNRSFAGFEVPQTGDRAECCRASWSPYR